jgi:hypothetical protein
MLRTGEQAATYRSRNLPWANKSRMGGFSFCEGSFLLQEIVDQKPKPIAQEMEEKTVLGANSHLVIAMFTKTVKTRDLIDTFMKIPLEHQPKNSNLYFAFYSLCEELMPPEAREVPEFCTVISNFCEWLVQCWLTVAQLFGHHKWAYEKYWLPIRSEIYLEIEEDKYFGTLDQVYNNPNYKVDKLPYIIAEFKSKEASKGVREYKGKDAFSAKLPTEKMQELHFEAHLAANGRIPKRVRVCSEDVQVSCDGCDGLGVKFWKNINPDTKTPVDFSDASKKYMEKGTVDDHDVVEPCNVCNGTKIVVHRCDAVVVKVGDKYACEKCNHNYTEDERNLLPVAVRMRKAFPLANNYKDFLAAIVFLGGDYPFSAPKRMNARTMENVHRDVNIMRQKWDDYNNPTHENYMNEDAFEWKMNDFVCQRCMRGAECSERKMRTFMEENHG